MTTSDRYPAPAHDDSYPTSDPSPRYDDSRDRTGAGSTDRRVTDEPDTRAPATHSPGASTGFSTGGFPDHDHDTARSATGSATGFAPTPTPRDGGVAGDGDGSNKLFSPARAQDYSTRWTAVKGEFVDEPRRAVGLADHLVGELLDELHESFSRQRHSLDHGLDTDQTSTEDLRIALGRYRDFFDRLLSL